MGDNVWTVASRIAYAWDAVSSPEADEQVEKDRIVKGPDEVAKTHDPRSPSAADSYSPIVKDGTSEEFLPRNALKKDR